MKTGRTALAGAGRLAIGPFDRLMAQGLSLGMAVNVAGCAIGELNSDIQSSQQSIEVKRTTLGAEESTQAALVQRRDRLRAELSQGEISLGDLKVRLDEMRQANEAAPAPTPQALRQREERTRRIDDAKRKVQAVESNPGPTEQERIKRRATVKEQTIKSLDLLFLG